MNETKKYWVKYTRGEKKIIKWFSFIETRNIFLTGIMKTRDYKNISWGRLG